jgi:hypothetical protein
VFVKVIEYDTKDDDEITSIKYQVTPSFDNSNSRLADDEL